ncbi:MAG: hypothetical protein DRN15_07775 [Thermoprotei archaeon]|nr:MAG: hypothetical protein DRN15_07775 [Thermoprotei archaeon]RLF25428.1 MAG: hypothetical protein DRM97_01860 [Thermoprotei archaeon]
MKALAISGIHGDINPLKEVLDVGKRSGVSLILCCGDIGSPSVVDILSGYSKARTLIVSGDLDDSYVVDILSHRNLLIDGRVVFVGGLIIAGLGGFRTRRRYHRVRNELMIKRVRGERLIILSHYPPNAEGPGSSYVRKLIRDFTPGMVICDHAHGEGEVKTMEKTLVVKLAPLSRGYYALLDLEHKACEIRRLKRS